MKINKFSLAAMLWLMLIPVVLYGATGKLITDLQREIRKNFLDQQYEYQVTIPSSFQEPKEGYDYLKLSPFPGAVPCGSFLVKVLFYKNNQLIKSSTLNAMISLYQQVYVSRERVKAKQPLTADMFEQAKREVTKLRDKPVSSLDGIEQMCAARTIARGKVLVKTMLKKEEVIKRGDLVLIELVKGNLKITAAGEARQAGGIGDRIKVKNINSNRIILAEVQDGQSVKVVR